MKSSQMSQYNPEEPFAAGETRLGAGSEGGRQQCRTQSRGERGTMPKDRSGEKDGWCCRV